MCMHVFAHVACNICAVSVSQSMFGPALPSAVDTSLHHGYMSRLPTGAVYDFGTLSLFPPCAFPRVQKPAGLQQCVP